MDELAVDLAPGLTGALRVPAEANGLVVLIDGSAGGREIVRHRYLAGYLQRRQFATLVLEFDAGDGQTGLPVARDGTRVSYLAHRLMQALAWVRREPALERLPIGVLGTGGGGAAAVICAAERPEWVSAIVTRAAPLPMVHADLDRLRSPILLVVGSLDLELLETTRSEYTTIAAEKRLELIPRATHLFEEAGALELVATAAADWFSSHLARPQSGAVAG